eukprot:TRINITY_DN802_c1_g1_i3.p1 TRINITY_DN802_c1_g1~~TRINITY_DN802_c1_g1_i3.p1  ORF type:complete len:514 (-),score=56.27 TRINITY_DN802_c1_g1_i3:14-1555(-)
MEQKDNLAHLNPNAHEFVPLQVKAGTCQKSVDYLCKMTGLETLLSLLQRQDSTGAAGASFNAPMHHHYPHLRNSLDRASASSVSSMESNLVPKQTASSFIPEEPEEEVEMFENRVRAKISGVRSQVSGVQRFSHALLYISDCGTPMRTAKLTSYEHFNEGLVQIFGNHIPAVLSHVHHDFFYHLVSDKLFYRVQLTFSFDDGPNIVKYDSRYGFTDALLNVYEKFSYMLESWGYSLLAGNTHPVRPESWFHTKAPILELVGRERMMYSKQELLSIAAILSMQGNHEDIVNTKTIHGFPDKLRIEHVSFVSRNVQPIHSEQLRNAHQGHTMHRRHHKRQNNIGNNKQADVVVVKKLTPQDRKKSDPGVTRGEEVVEVRRSSSLKVPATSNHHHEPKKVIGIDEESDDDSHDVVIVNKENHDKPHSAHKKNHKNNRKARKSQDKHSDERTSSSASEEASEKHDVIEVPKTDEKEPESKPKRNRRRRRGPKKTEAADKSSEEVVTRPQQMNLPRDH